MIAADRTYHPSLHRQAAEWNGTQVLALTTDGEPAGMYAFTTPSAIGLLKRCPAGVRTLDELHAWLAAAEGLVCESVPSRPVATRIVGGRPPAGGTEAGPMAVQIHRRRICENEPQGIDSDQPPADQIPHHAEYGEPVHAWRQLRGRRLLRVRRPRKTC